MPHVIHVSQRDAPPVTEVLQLNARDVGWGHWACVIVMLALSQAAGAQCVRNVFLAIGGPTPAVSAVGLPVVLSGDAPPVSSLTAAGDPVVRLSEAQILALPTALIVTATDWTPTSRFEGPLLRDVLKLGSGGSSALHVFSLNQYAVTIPMSDLDHYAPILAHTRDGVRLRRSDFGPLFIVYPRDQFKTLESPKMAARMAWQVCRIDVE